MPETMPARRLFTPDEYLIIERRAEFKSEYLDGEIFAVSGVTLAHNRITGNLLMELGQQLKGKPIQLLGSDMRIGVTARGPYFYPDISIVCGKPQLRDNTKDCLMNPVVIVEVLSPFHGKLRPHTEVHQLSAHRDSYGFSAGLSGRAAHRALYPPAHRRMAAQHHHRTRQQPFSLLDRLRITLLARLRASRV
jgi:Putative restriction endonuclease